MPQVSDNCHPISKAANLKQTTCPWCVCANVVACRWSSAEVCWCSRFLFDHHAQSVTPRDWLRRLFGSRDEEERATYMMPLPSSDSDAELEDDDAQDNPADPAVENTWPLGLGGGSEVDKKQYKACCKIFKKLAVGTTLQEYDFVSSRHKQ